MNFLQGFNGVSNSGPTQGQGMMGGQQGMMRPYGGSPYTPLGGQLGAPGPYTGSPWQTQPMQPPGLLGTAQQLEQQWYLPAGTSADIPEYDPTVPGGGMHQQQLGGAAPAPAPAPSAAIPAPPQTWQTTGIGGGQIFADKNSASDAATLYNNTNVADGGFGIGDQGFSPTGALGGMRLPSNDQMRGMSGTDVLRYMYGG